MSEERRLLIRGGRTLVVSLRKNLADIRMAISSGKLSGARMYELRYDLAGDPAGNIGEMIRTMKEEGLDFIFTFRGSAHESVRAYTSAINAGADIIDIDFSLLKQTGSLDCRKIISFHGDWRKWNDVLPDILRSDPYAVKLASPFQNIQEFVKAMSEATSVRERIEVPFCFSPMGNIPAMRYFACLYVSDFCYARLDEPTADGQPTADQYELFLQLAEES